MLWSANLGAEALNELARTRRRNVDKVDPGIGTTRLGQRIFECVFLIGTRSAQSIMASGFTAAQTGRTHDRTRPMLQLLGCTTALAVIALQSGRWRQRHRTTVMIDCSHGESRHARRVVGKAVANTGRWEGTARLTTSAVAYSIGRRADWQVGSSNYAGKRSRSRRCRSQRGHCP